MSYTYPGRPRKPKQEPIDTAGQTENFFTRHVKLITFLVTVGLFLVVVGPILIFGVAQDWMEPHDLPKMKVEDVIALSEQNTNLKLSQFTCFEGEMQEWSFGDYYVIEIGSRYTLVCGADPKTEVVFYCELKDSVTERQLDVMNEDMRAYFAAQAG